MTKQQLKNLAFTGHYYSLEFKGASKSEHGLLKTVNAIFAKADDDGGHRDIRSFDAQIKDLLPPGYIYGGGAHHIWIHKAEDEGKRPGVPESGIWVHQDYRLYYKYVDSIMPKGSTIYFSETDSETVNRLSGGFIQHTFFARRIAKDEKNHL